MSGQLNVTRMADVVTPEIFSPYVVQRTMELSALVQSGIVENSAEFDALASQPATTINMPFWKDLANTADEVLDDSEPLSPNKITTGKDIAVILRRGQVWAANDLAANLAGDDPMRVIADLVASYWARRLQTALLSVLEGIFKAAGDGGGGSMAGLVLDITSDNGTINGASFVDAAQKLGDAKEQLTGVLMHSATEASLAKQDLIQTERDSEGKVAMKTFMGKRVIVDDGCPVDGEKYTTYLFGAGAIALGNGSPVGFVPTEVARDSLAGEDYLVNRKTFILHPRGIRYNGSISDKKSPDNDALKEGTNWYRVYEEKAIRMVAFVHELNGSGGE